jgi:hypothetical protein
MLGCPFLICLYGGPILDRLGSIFISMFAYIHVTSPLATLQKHNFHMEGHFIAGGTF